MFASGSFAHPYSPCSFGSMAFGPVVEIRVAQSTIDDMLQIVRDFVSMHYVHWVEGSDHAAVVNIFAMSGVYECATMDVDRFFCSSKGGHIHLYNGNVCLIGPHADIP